MNNHNMAQCSSEFVATPTKHSSYCYVQPPQQDRP